MVTHLVDNPMVEGSGLLSRLYAVNLDMLLMTSPAAHWPHVKDFGTCVNDLGTHVIDLGTYVKDLGTHGNDLWTHVNDLGTCVLPAEEKEMALPLCSTMKHRTLTYNTLSRLIQSNYRGESNWYYY